MSKRVCILSIDGGGIRGILPGVIIDYLEHRLQCKSNNPNARISDYFDLIAGTSTGGILACIYLVPDANGRPKYTASQAVKLYLEHGHRIFGRTVWRRLTNPLALRNSKYSPKNLEKILKQYLGDTKLSESLKPCLMTAYEIFQRKAVFFNMADKSKHPDGTKDFKLRDVARSTSAAPTYFPPASIQSEFGAPFYLVDGGMFANNPAMCAYSEARTMDFKAILGNNDKPTRPDVDNMLIVSIGTGSEGQSYSYRSATKWGVVRWLQPVITILMSGNSETVHYQLNRMFGSNGTPCDGYYFRLAPGIEMAKSDMDEATPENMQALQEAGKGFVTAHQEELEKIVDLLIVNN